MGAPQRPRRRLAARLYRWLMLSYPRHRRRQDGDDMGEMFSDIYSYEEDSKGLRGRGRLGADTARDLSIGVLAERRPLLDQFLQDIRHGMRRLRGNPLLTIAAVLTLALGIGAVTSIYSFVNALVLNPLPYPDVDRLVVLGDTTPRRALNGEGWSHPPEYRGWQDLESLESLAALSPFWVTMTGAGDPAEVIGYRATANFFDVLSVEPMLGRAFASGGAEADIAADSAAVVLGYAFWQRHFDGDPEILGRRFRLRDREAIVVGVMPRGTEFPMGTDLWVPLEMTPQQWSSFESRTLRPIGRLAPGATVEQLRAELAPLDARAAEVDPDGHADVRVAVESVLQNITTNTRQALAFLMGAAGFLLLLVCGNVANIQLAQAAGRQQEMAMRMALGARRGRLVRQLLTESMALALLAAMLGTLFAAWGIRILRVGLEGERWRFFFSGMDAVGINTPVLLFAMLVALGSVMVFGLMPALHGSRVDLNEALKRSSATASGARGRLRRSLVVVEVALSVVLLIGAGLMANSMGAFGRFEPGVDAEVLSVRLRLPEGYGDMAELRSRSFVADSIARVGAVAGLTPAGFSNRMPVTGDERGTAYEIEAADPVTATPGADRHVVAGDYFATVGITVLRGRAFDSRDAGGAPVAIVSDRLAERAWPGEPAVGKRLRFDPEEPWRTVVGVVSNVAAAWNDRRPAAAIYVPHAQAPTSSMMFLLRAGGDTEATMAALRREIWAIDDAVVVFAPLTIQESLDEEAGGMATMTRLVGWMASVALLVCLAGIYALVAYAAVQRTREIGVRLALGAERSKVVAMLVVQSLRTTGVGLAIGMLAAYGMATALAGFMEGVLAFEPRVFLALAGGMLLLAAFSGWLPARRAARVDPVVTLRAE